MAREGPNYARKDLAHHLWNLITNESPTKSRAPMARDGPNMLAATLLIIFDFDNK
jgi:hypothetical protein